MRGRNRRPFDRHQLAMLLGAIAVVGVLATTGVAGPGRLFDWLVSFLLPTAVILLLVVVVTLGLAVQGVLRCWTAGANRHLRTPGIPLQARASPIRCTGCL